jgi:hypothetical protein
MFKVIRKQTRPNTGVPFWQGQNSPLLTAEFMTYYAEKFMSTGKFINADTTISNDGLELTTETLWDSEESYNEYTSDETCIAQFINLANNHFETNGITSTEISRGAV